jgi:eukaryotic-like serine/threonine-protein kinase
MTTTDKAEEVLRVAAGDVVAGKYRVERVLGQGAMGIVVAARHEDLGQKVAIKLLHPDVSASDDGRERFLREARAAAKLESDHVARVFDVGTFGEKNAYMVMEHLEGSDLEKFLDMRGSLPIDEAVDYVLEALEALAHAHAHGMVHRDIKPSNLFLVERMDGTRRVKILDFGISKTESGLGVSSPGSSTLTSPHAVLGSPAYMAPEQIRSSKNVDQRADIWSVGVMLYELVTGKSPFIGETIGDTLARVLASRPEPITNFRSDVPQQLVDAIFRCLEPEESRRFQNVAELADVLAPLASPRTRDLPQRIARVLSIQPNAPRPRAIVPSDSGVQINVAAETLAVDGSSPRGTQITASSNKSSAENGKSSRSVAIGAVFALLVVAGIGYVVTRPEPAPQAPVAADRPVEKPNSIPAQGAPMPSAAPVSPGPMQVVPIAETSAQAAPTASVLDAAPKTTASVSPIEVKSAAKPLPTSSTKKTTPAPNSTIPSGILDGRD